MKLWMAMDSPSVPQILREGLSNPHGDMIPLFSDRDIPAEGIYDFPEGEMELLEIEIPDEALENYLAICLEYLHDEADSIESDLEDLRGQNGDSKDIERTVGYLRAVRRVLATEDVWEALKVTQGACVAQDADPIPPAWIRRVSL